MDYNRQTDFETFSLQTSSPLSYHELQGSWVIYNNTRIHDIYIQFDEELKCNCIAQHFYHMLDKVLEMFL